jgi:hypothetical protein
VAHRFEDLEETFDFGFVFGAEELVLGGRSFLLFDGGRDDFAPALDPGDTVNQRFAGVAAEVAKERVGGIEVTGIDEEEAFVVHKCDKDGQGRNPAGAIDAADVHPGDGAAADDEELLLNFDGRAEGEEHDGDGAEEEEHGTRESEDKLRGKYGRDHRESGSHETSY